MTATEILDALDGAGVPYVARNGRLLYRKDAVLPDDLADAIDKARADLAAEATHHDPTFLCHHCSGIVRAGLGRVVHPPDWPERMRDRAPVMHTWCFAMQPWWRLDVDDPCAAFAAVLADAEAGRIPESGAIALDKCTTICNPRESVISNARRIREASCWWRTSAQGADAFARIEAVAEWWVDELGRAA